MTDERMLRAVAGAAASSVVQHEAVGALDRLLEEGAAALGASAAGVLVLGADERLELLAATSHAVSELEAYQCQRDQGPCVDAVRSGEPVAAADEVEMVSRWPEVGPVIVASGYGSVHAAPLRWLDRTFGGFNLFFDDRTELHPDLEAATRALADTATLVIVTSGSTDPGSITATLVEALAGRAVVEQAKGALAHLRDLDMAGAFAALRVEAEAAGVPLGEAARALVERARLGRMT